MLSCSLFVFFLCLMCSMLQVSLVCPLIIATSVFSNVFFYLSVDYCDLALWTVQLLQSRHYWKTWFSLVSAKLFTWRSTTITDIRLPIPFIRMFCTILLWFVAIYYLHSIQFTKKQSINHGGFNIIGFCNINQHFLLSVGSCVIREN